MKKNPNNIGAQPPVFKFDLKLKLTSLFFLVALFSVKAATYAQTKVSLDLKNTPVEKVIETIEQKTDFRFIYNISDVDLDRTISIKVKDSGIDAVLALIFKGTGIDYKMSGTQILLKRPLATSKSINYIDPIKGRVLDENGIPLPGATVMVAGTKNIVTTDVDGYFTIDVDNTDAIIVITYIGYMEKKIAAGVITAEIRLSPSISELNEVVVVGYGTTKRRDVTGAVSSIAAKDMNQGAITNPLQLIGGKMAGVNINQTGSEPGSAPSVRIRGISSLIGGSDPLVVVDGIQGNMDLLNQIAPSDIETVDVLKDASATAIYGSRGAPGVIIVTTKKSKTGTTTVEFNATSSFDMIPKKMDMLSAGEWWQAAQANGVPAIANHGANTDWFDILTRTGFTQNYNLSFGGGTENFNYRASLTAILQEGVVINSQYNKYIGRIQATQKALDGKLRLTFNLSSGLNEENKMIQSIGRASFTSNLISNAYLMRPTDPVYNTDGTYFTDPAVFQYLNPYAAAETTVDKTQLNNLFGSLRTDLDLFEGLTAGWFGSWRKTDFNEGYFQPVASTSAFAIDQKGFANVRDNKTNEKLMNMSLTYAKVFGDHSVNVLGLYEWQNQTYTGLYAQARGFINDSQTFNALQLGDFSRAVPGDVQSYKNDRTLVSFLGRANYTFKDRYLLTASLRRDGSSVFGANNKWGNFPSASLGWQIDKEPFMANQKIFSELKVRGGYGVTGNQQGLAALGSISLVQASGTTYFGGATIPNYEIRQNNNPNLKWETKEQTNIGLDFTAANNRLRGTVDVYRAVTSDLLFTYTVPVELYPFNSMVANVGSLENKGLEVSLGYDLIKTENTTLTLTGNASFMKNKVLSLGGFIDGRRVDTNYVGWGTNAWLIEGQPIGVFNTMHHTGKDSENAETVQDVNGDGFFDQGNDSADKRLSGQSLPKYTFGFNPRLQYKNFDVSMLWRGSGGNKIYNGIRATLSFTENIGRSNVLASAIPLGIRTSQYGSSDLWLEDGSFIRLDNATVGYSFKFKEQKYIQSLRLSMTGNNLLLVTDYSGLDPELNFTGGSTGGGDNGIYPRTRTIAFGLNVQFK